MTDNEKLGETPTTGADMHASKQEHLSNDPISNNQNDEHESNHDTLHDVDLEKEGEVDKPSVPADDKVYITGFKLYIVMVSLSLVAFLMLLDVAIVATAIPRITSDFNSLQDVGWYGSAYLLANSSLQPLAGRMYTHFGSKKIFLGFFAIFELGSLLCGVSQSSKMLIVSRAVAGIGGAGLVNGALTILSNAVPLHKRPVFMGGLMGFAQMGVVIGPLIGGAFTEYTTWRWCFYINLPIGGLVAILLILIRIPDTEKTREDTILKTIWTKLDPVGFCLFAPSIIQLLLAIDYGGNTYPWNSATVIGLFCGAAANFAVFLGWEFYKGETAMLPLAMLKERIVAASCLLSFFFFSMMQLVIYYLPIYFQAIKGASPMASGVDLLPSILAQLIGSISSGVAVTKLGYYLPFCVIASVLASIGHGLLSTLSPSSSSAKWIGYQVLVGFGRGLGLQMPFIAIQNALPPSMVSISMSLLTFLQTLGGALMLSFGETIFTNSLRTLIPKYAKGVSPEAIILGGATGIRDVVSSPAQLKGVLSAYSVAIDRVFCLVIGCSSICFVLAWGVGWKDIRKNKNKKESDQVTEAQAEEAQGS